MEHKYVDIEGIKVGYTDEGSGFPVFFIPPWASSGVAFEGLTRFILDSTDSIRIIRVDMPSWGGATKGHMKVSDFQSYVEIVAKFINSFGFSDFGTLGYSLGVAFILHGIEQGLINPTKSIFVSGFHGRSNVFDVDSKLRYNFFIVKRLMGWKIPSPIVKSIICMFYILELITIKLYRDNAKYFIKLISTAMKGDLSSTFIPMLTLKDLDKGKDLSKRSKYLVLYNVNEPWYFQQFSREIGQMINVTPVTIEAFSHRHLSFEPEKSYNIIKDFISE